MLHLKVAFLCVFAFLVIGVRKSPITSGDFFASIGQQRIHGGDQARPGQFPYQASLRVNGTRGFTHLCGGTIITNRFVVTAAHCTPTELQNTPSKARLVLGAHTITDNGDAYEVQRIFIYPQWNSSRLLHDISLVQTVEEIRFTPIVQRIPILRIFVNTTVRAVTSGWGLTNVSRYFIITENKFFLLRICYRICNRIVRLY